MCTCRGSRTRALPLPVRGGRRTPVRIGSSPNPLAVCVLFTRRTVGADPGGALPTSPLRVPQSKRDSLTFMMHITLMNDAVSADRATDESRWSANVLVSGL